MTTIDLRKMLRTATPADIVNLLAAVLPCRIPRQISPIAEAIVADKAQAVAEAIAAEQKKTAAVRAELVALLVADFWRHDVGGSPVSGKDWHGLAVMGGVPSGERLVELGVWQKRTAAGYVDYRPIESEASDEAAAGN